MSSNWTQFALGIWLLISPWLLGFSSISTMKWSNVLTGLILVLINVWIIFGEKKPGSETSTGSHGERK